MFFKDGIEQECEVSMIKTSYISYKQSELDGGTRHSLVQLRELDT